MYEWITEKKAESIKEKLKFISNPVNSYFIYYDLLNNIFLLKREYKDDFCPYENIDTYTVKKGNIKEIEKDINKIVRSKKRRILYKNNKNRKGLKND